MKGYFRSRFWSLLSFCGAVIVYFAGFRLVIERANPSASHVEALTPGFLWEESGVGAAAVIGNVMPAIYAYLFPSLMLLIVASAAILLAFGVVLCKAGAVARTIALGLTVLGTAMGAVFQGSNTLRAFAADCLGETAGCPLDRAVAAGIDGAPLSAAQLDHLTTMVTVGASVATGAVMSLAVAFYVLARRAPEAALTAPALRARKRALIALLAVSGAHLAFAVASTHGYYHIAVSMMTEESAKPFRALASAGAGYWGLLYSTLLLVLVLPVVLSFLEDSRRAARLGKPEETSEDAWLRAEGLTFDFNARIGTVVAALAPVMTTPVLDLVAQVAGG